MGGGDFAGRQAGRRGNKIAKYNMRWRETGRPLALLEGSVPLYVSPVRGNQELSRSVEASYDGKVVQFPTSVRPFITTHAKGSESSATRAHESPPVHGENLWPLPSVTPLASNNAYHIPLQLPHLNRPKLRPSKPRRVERIMRRRFEFLNNSPLPEDPIISYVPAYEVPLNKFVSLPSLRTSHKLSMD